MKIKTLMLLTLFVVVIALIGLTTVEQTAAQTQGTENLLVNPGFEAGHYNQNNVAELTVPNGWKIHYVEGVTFPGAWDNLPAHRPESVVWNSIGGVPEGEEVFWRDGSYTLKVFKSWAPMYSAISQDVTGLEVGRRYRLIAPVYPDIVMEYSGGKKIPPDRPDAGQVRLGAGPTGAAWRDEGAIAYSGWWTGGTIADFYQNYSIFVHDFTATQENMTVWVEFRSTYPYPNNGFFMDTIGLYTLDEVDNSVTSPSPAGSGAPAPAGPAPTPFPTPTPRADGAVIHVVQSGDTFWTIAIRYAGVMGLSPEDALPAIRELNNNPAFINIGQELVIVEPGATAPAEEPTPEPVETAEEASAAEEPTAEAEQEPTPEPETIAETAVDQPDTNNAICVAAFDDADGNGAHDAGEGYLADAAVSLFRAGQHETTYVTDGINEPYCFESLEADSYQVQIFPPADYMMTTTGSWAVAVSNNMDINVEFGIQYNPGANQVAVAATAVPSAEETPDASSTEDGSTNVGLYVLGGAAVLVLLAGVGVILLRKS